ncbi:MAG: porin, partial [Gammaproteobacteria bacterium]|nr:porin [Gammaproteobacteria bacterium]
MKCPSKTLTALAVTAFLAPIAADAAKVNVKISGQINRAVTYADNDIDDDVVFVDNNASGTRIRLTGDTELPSGNKAGVHWETQYQDNSSSAIDVDSGDSSSEFNS